MRFGTEISSLKIKPSDRQGYELFLNRFSLYSELVMQNLGGYPGFQVGHETNKLRHVDCIVFIVIKNQNIENLEHLVPSGMI